MTIDEIREEKAGLETAIRFLVDEFEKRTDTKVEGVLPLRDRVKVDIIIADKPKVEAA